jgi:hypothetical protein
MPVAVDERRVNCFLEVEVQEIERKTENSSAIADLTKNMNDKRFYTDEGKYKPIAIWVYVPMFQNY